MRAHVHPAIGARIPEPSPIESDSSGLPIGDEPTLESQQPTRLWGQTWCHGHMLSQETTICPAVVHTPAVCADDSDHQIVGIVSTGSQVVVEPGRQAV